MYVKYNKVRVVKKLEPFEQVGSQLVLPSMLDFCDKIVTISEVIEDGNNVCYCIEEDGGKYLWTDKMFQNLVGNKIRGMVSMCLSAEQVNKICKYCDIDYNTATDKEVIDALYGIIKNL